MIDILKNKPYRTLFFIIILTLLFPLTSVVAFDENDNKHNNDSDKTTLSTDVNALPVLDKDLQIEGESYFHYDVTGLEGETINSSFLIKNLKDEELEISIEIGDGLTSTASESVVYNNDGKTNNSGFTDEEYMMSNLVEGLPETVVLNPKETKEISFKINIPKDAEGQYIGVIRFNRVTDEKEAIGSDNVSINLRIGYTMGLWFRSGDIKDAELDIKGVQVDSGASVPNIDIHLINNNPEFLKDGELIYKVIRNNDNQIIFKGEKKLEVMSPKNYLWYPIRWDGELKPGKYTIFVNDKEFDFEISKSDIDPSKDEDGLVIIFTEKIPLWVWISLGSLIIIILLLLIKRKRDIAKENDGKAESGSDKDESEEHEEIGNDEGTNDSSKDEKVRPDDKKEK